MYPNNDFTNKNNAFFEYTNPTQVIKQGYLYTTNYDNNLKAYLNQPYNENNSNFYAINYLPPTNEINNNNYSYNFSDTIKSEGNNKNYFNYIVPTHSNEYISNTNYNNLGNIKNTVKSNFVNLSSVQPQQISIKDKNENINYNYYYNTINLLNPSTNANYNIQDTTNYYKGLNATSYLGSNLISNTTNNINSINLNENYTNYVINDNSTFKDSFNYVPMPNKIYNLSYNNISKNNNNNIQIITNTEKNLYNNQIKSIEGTGIKLYDYLSGYYDQIFEPHQYYDTYGGGPLNDERNKYKNDFKKDSLKNIFLYDLEKLKIKLNKDYIVYYFKTYKENKKDDSNLYIDIFCPFFELLSIQEYFSDLFTIPIDMSFIKSNKITNEYIAAFDRLNQLKQKYSILFKFYTVEDFNFFNRCINLN